MAANRNCLISSRSLATADDFNKVSCRQRAFSFIKDKQLDLLEYGDGIRPRTSSMPTKSSVRKPTLLHLNHRHHTHEYNANEHDADKYPVRMFKVNSKGVIKSRSDSMRSRGSASFSSEGEMCRMLSQSSLASSSSHDSISTYKSLGNMSTSYVKVLGGTDVGKTALMQQFMTSEYMGGFDTSNGKNESFFYVSWRITTC